MSEPVEQFEPLTKITGLRSTFIGRIPGVDVVTDRDEALRRLKAPHDDLIARLGFSPPVTAEQVHGNKIAVVDGSNTQRVPDTDGLITSARGITLGIYVADCAAIYVVDPVCRVIALLHSGRKGTEQNILGGAIEILESMFHSNPKDLTVVVSPCIRPPQYEVNFSGEIAAQAREAGVGVFHDSGANTATNLDRYYSYRVEKGQTGRMLALMELLG